MFFHHKKPKLPGRLFLNSFFFNYTSQKLRYCYPRVQNLLYGYQTIRDPVIETAPNVTLSLTPKIG